MHFMFEAEYLVLAHALKHALHALESLNRRGDCLGIICRIGWHEFSHGSTMPGDLKFLPALRAFQQLAKMPLCVECSDRFHKRLSSSGGVIDSIGAGQISVTNVFAGRQSRVIGTHLAGLTGTCDCGQRRYTAPSF